MSVKPGTVVAVIVVVVSLSLAGIALYSPNADKARLTSLENELQTLRERVTRLSYNTASGGGVNLKLMPDPVTGQPTVPLEEVFSFDRNHAMCRVDTNRQAFKMATYQLGEIVVAPNAFFMSMVATSIEQYILDVIRNKVSVGRNAYFQRVSASHMLISNNSPYALASLRAFVAKESLCVARRLLRAAHNDTP